MGRPSGRGGPRNLPPTAPNSPTTFKGQQYGSLPPQLAVQNAAPQGAAAVAPQPQGQPQFSPGSHAPPPGVPAPGEFPPLLAPTDRPGEPVTHGLPFGPGANALPQTFKPDPMVQAAALLASIPSVHQTPQMLALLNATRASVANSSGPTVAQSPQ